MKNLNPWYFLSTLHSPKVPSQHVSGRFLPSLHRASSSPVCPPQSSSSALQEAAWLGLQLFYFLEIKCIGRLLTLFLRRFQGLRWSVCCQRSKCEIFENIRHWILQSRQSLDKVSLALNLKFSKYCQSTFQKLCCQHNSNKSFKYLIKKNSLHPR